MVDAVVGSVIMVVATTLCFMPLRWQSVHSIKLGVSPESEERALLEDQR